MQNVALKNALSTGHIPIGFSSTIPHGFLDLVDFNAVVRTIMMKPKDHNGARYELVAQNISYDEIAEIISKASGKQVQCKIFSAKEFVDKMNVAGEVQNEFAEDILERLMLYYNRWCVNWYYVPRE
jgi:type II secretory pathway component GspD/PulD (secretin)